MKKFLFCTLLIILFSCPFPVEAAELTITRHPENCRTYAGYPAEFSVAATGTEPLTYQWQRLDGSTWNDILGANAANYFFTAQRGDHGASFRVVVSDSNGSVTSNIAMFGLLVGMPLGYKSGGGGCSNTMFGGGTFGILIVPSALLVCCLWISRRKKQVKLR